MNLSVTYKNGNTLNFDVYYAHCENGKLYFSQKKTAPHSAVTVPVEIPLENIASFECRAMEEDG